MDIDPRRCPYFVILADAYRLQKGYLSANLWRDFPFWDLRSIKRTLSFSRIGKFLCLNGIFGDVNKSGTPRASDRHVEVTYAFIVIGRG